MQVFSHATSEFHSKDNSIHTPAKIAPKTNSTISSNKADNSSKNFGENYSTNLIATKQFENKADNLERNVTQHILFK